MPLNDDAINFLKYAFTETKDLAEHFLTVVTAALVFSLTFSEKVANFSTATTRVRVSITAACSCMLLAIIAVWSRDLLRSSLGRLSISECRSRKILARHE